MRNSVKSDPEQNGYARVTGSGKPQRRRLGGECNCRTPAVWHTAYSLLLYYTLSGGKGKD